MNKLIFLLITLCSILTTSAHAQWWVSGGNLLWPHGNVSITNGSLNLTGDLNFTGNRFLSLTNALTIKDNNGNSIGTFSGGAGFGLGIMLGDYSGAANSVYLSIDDNEIRATNLVTESLSMPGIVQGVNLSDPPVVSELEIFDTSPDGFISLLQDTNTSKYYLVYKISNGQYIISLMQLIE